MPWGADAFARAAAEDKPILLSISAVWCHWCHVMDETSYSDAAVIETIGRRFVPVRVDNDRRPDVNARYNMGGWPTTAFLAPDGTTLTGATYLPPAQMHRALEEIADFYAEHKDDVAKRGAEMRERHAAHAHGSSESLDDGGIARILEQMSDAFDAQYGGFGEAPKFPQPELLELLLLEWRISGDERLHEMAAKTVLGMARGGTYDRVEGGFFRYSTTRDWSVPHFEKMAEDHAGLLRVLAQLAIFAPSGEFHATLVSAVGYVRSVLYDPQTGFFAGSQDADEVYYELPLEERRERAAPYVDRTSYTNWTCALAGSLCLVARALDDDALLREALRTLDNVHDRTARRRRSGSSTRSLPEARPRYAGCSPTRSPICAPCSTRTRSPASRGFYSERRHWPPGSSSDFKPKTAASTIACPRRRNSGASRCATVRWARTACVRTPCCVSRR